MTKEQLDEILKNHKMWLNNEPGGKRANLQDANLRGADLRGANLWGAIFREADLRGADLRGADLREANLWGAIFWKANLRGADLRRTNLWKANLRGADLREADLQGAYLRGADNIPDYVCPLCCPEKGSFIGFKRAWINNGNTPVIVEIEIPADAKRSSATTRKCRCSKAKVLSMTDLNGVAEFQEAHSQYNSDFVYEIGEIVEVDDFDEDRWNECSTGIHFFITRSEAVNY